jgi:hypothetical protein
VDERWELAEFADEEAIGDAASRDGTLTGRLRLEVSAQVEEAKRLSIDISYDGPS